MEDKENTEKYTIGDLLWAKIGNHPFWPCMVSYHPYEGCYKKSKKVAYSTDTIYHVQYFGKLVQHGWTTPGQIFPFEGEKKFFERRDYLITNADNSSTKKKIDAKYNIPAKCKELWQIAVKEAELALSYEIKERFETFVFQYVFNSKKSIPTSDSATVKRNALALVNGEINDSPSKKTKIYNSNEYLCKICERKGADISCTGYCTRFFHKECIGIIYVPKVFKCIDCENGVYLCFICKKYDISLMKCEKCSNYYHEQCLQKYECANLKKKICPLHTCLTCYKENPRKVTHRGPFVECFRCPTAFHNRESCIPAGSVNLKYDSFIVCPEHYLGKGKISPQPTSNVLYCTACFEGGELICCEACPNSYHVECIDIEIPDGDFFCDSCLNREYLYCGMIVWAKTGAYRWWPAEIMHYEEVPYNIKNLEHHHGEFPVQYFGTYEYFWTHRGRVVPYAQHLNKIRQNKIRSKPCRLTSLYKISLEEAAKAYDSYMQLRIEERSVNEKPDPYRHIRVNRAVPPAQINTLDAKSVLPCSCDPAKPNPCGLDSMCLNRSMLMECHPDVCKAKELCENQKFQRRQYASVKLIKTKSTGWGLESCEIIKKGSFVIEYVGEIITHQEYHRRSLEMREKNIQNYYFLYIDSRRMIDAGPKGNLSRFINHSCNPNCEMVKWSVNGDARIGIFAVTDILPGEELTFNYQADNIEFEQKCHCGASNCQEFIGRKSNNGKKK